MKKRYLVIFLLGIGLVSLCTAAEKSSHGQSFKAELSGGEVVPAVNTKAKGEATFQLSKDGKELQYTITASDTENITAAHIHKGKRGENGPPIALILIGKKTVKGTDTIAKGTIKEKEMMASFSGKSVKDLVNEIGSGNTYVNVHTAKYPDGEIRGQIK